MKLAITATGQDLDAQVDPRFGRCATFILVDPDTLEYEALTNTAASSSGGSGIQAAQSLVDRDVTAVLTGQVGPNAYRVLTVAQIKVYTGTRGTARDTIDHFKAGELVQVEQATVGSHAGMGGRGGNRW